MKTKDLGTYHVRVEFEGGRGFIYRWDTGMRFTGGTASSSPLTAQIMQPCWGGEEGLLGNIEFMFTEGNYSCDCNKKIFLREASGARKTEFNDDDECGDKIVLRKLTVIRPDGTEKILLP